MADPVMDAAAKPWHADDIDQMGEYFFFGKSIPQVATLMSRSCEAVRTKAEALNLLPKRSSRLRRR